MSINNISLLRVVAVSGACGLVLASSGFGSVYAWSVGAEHSIALAGLSVLMALAIEAIKPLAVSAALAAWRRTGVSPPALGLTLLAGISVAYSLTAELSLISQTRGDLAAERNAQSIDASSAQRTRLRIEAELQSLGVVRPSKAIEADLLPYLADPRLQGCASKLDNWRLNAICKDKVSPLRSELAVAERREALEGQLRDKQTIAAPDADPASTAVVAYLAALGVSADARSVGLWLLLVPVLAMEIGSALAHVLVQAFPASRVPNPLKTDGLEQALACVGASLLAAPEPLVQPVYMASEAPRAKVKAAIVDHLKANGGQVEGGERGLAKLIGSSRGTMKRALQGLVLAGIVSLEASRNGTMLRLVS